MTGRILRSRWHVAARSVLQWPTRTDYAEWYARQGLINDEASFDEAYEIHGPVFLDWVKRGQTACRFASRLAHTHVDAGWQSIVIGRAVAGEELARMTTDLLATHIEEAEIVQLLFPHVTNSAQLGQLIDDLCIGNPERWYWEAIGEIEDDWINLGLRWTLPDDQSTAWTVGFGPFDFLPITRQAPITGVLIRTSSVKRTTNEADVFGRIPVHLADMDDQLTDSSVRDHLTAATVDAKANYLNGIHASAARARVTFRVRRDSFSSEPRS